MAKRKNMRGNLTLTEWISNNGVANVAKLLKVETATVRYWHRGDGLPKDSQKRLIKKVTKGLVNYDGIIDGGRS